jgi:hypothetical protein
MTRSFLTMSELATKQPSAEQRWPMTGEAVQALVDEVAHLRAGVVTLAGVSVLNDGMVHLPLIRSARRLDVLSAVLDAAERMDESDCAVIGRRVTLLESEGDSVTYALVFPGDGDPGQGWISADSPLGMAILRCAAGDRVEVVAPGGCRVVTVLSVD